MADETNRRAKIIPLRPDIQVPTTPAPSLWQRLAALMRDIADFKKNQGWYKRLVMALPPWVTPNRVTFFRSLFIVPLWYILAVKSHWAALAAFAFSMALDSLDGAIAWFKPHLKTPDGAFWDPLADKVMICGTFLILLGHKLVPPFFAIGIYPICFLAVFNTLVRVYKMAKIRQYEGERRVPNGHSTTAHQKQASVAATDFGKVKLVNETTAGLLMILGLALGWPWVVLVGGAFLFISLFFALGSAKDQPTF